MKEAYYLKNHLQPPNALLICLATCSVDQFRCQEPRVSSLSLFWPWPFNISSPWPSCLQATRLGPAVPGVNGVPGHEASHRQRHLALLLHI